MASDVDICNLALGHLGDSATVSSINPPEGSAQAEHCARFYPIARDALLEMHPWGFATRRVQLAQLTSWNFTEWQYCYQQPADAVNLLTILPATATDDISVGIQNYTQQNVSMTNQGVYQPQPYVAETLDDGTEILLTNVPNAVLRYTCLVTDTNKFSPLFVTAFSWYLASYLAGPVIKGEVGAAEAKRCYAEFVEVMGRATSSDANQRRIQPAMNTPWIAGR